MYQLSFIDFKIINYEFGLPEDEVNENMLIFFSIEGFYNILCVLEKRHKLCEKLIILSRGVA